MKKILWKLRINYYVGSYIWKERIKSKRTCEDAASHINVPVEKLVSYEKGTQGIPLCYIVKLARFYAADELDLVFKINTISFSLKNKWAIVDCAGAFIHRFQVQNYFTLESFLLRPRRFP